MSPWWAGPDDAVPAARNVTILATIPAVRKRVSPPPAVSRHGPRQRPLLPPPRRGRVGEGVAGPHPHPNPPPTRGRGPEGVARRRARGGTRRAGAEKRGATRGGAGGSLRGFLTCGRGGSGT